MDPLWIDDLVRRFGEQLPPGMAALREDFERNSQALLQAALAKLDLVTREEFEVQREVLARTRAQLEQLELQVIALEQRVIPVVGASSATASAPANLQQTAPTSHPPLD